jgi:hypothetical protein
MKTTLSKFNEAQEIDARNVAIGNSHHPCACGCGTLIPIKSHYKVRTWANGHQNRGRKLTEEWIRNAAQAKKGMIQTKPLAKKGPTNKRSKSGVLRDSSGRIWPFVNLTHFVREHATLFAPEDVAWKKIRGGERCRASTGLAKLFQNNRHSKGTWKGWTAAFSIMERAEGGGDLLGRDYATVVELAK